MNRVQSCIWDKLCAMSGEEVARTLTNWHGNQLLDEGLYKSMVDDGLMDDELHLCDDSDNDEDDDYDYEDD